MPAIHPLVIASEQQTTEWQNATEALLLVVGSKTGLTMLARIGVMRALNRGYFPEFTPSRTGASAS